MRINQQTTPSIVLPVDHSTQRQKNESSEHWAGKAAIVFHLQSQPDYEGQIETEKKVEDLIADVRCTFSKCPEEWPERLVIEVQTPRSRKNIQARTRRHLRFGYAVCWVFTSSATEERREAEDAMREYMSETPSFGVVAPDDSELQFGSPVTTTNYSDDLLSIPFTELYIPTYHRYRTAFDHGDFSYEDEQVSLITISNQLWVSWRVGEDGQRTLPERAPWTDSELSQAFLTDELNRSGPVRGPP
ncbi:hypothetical protein ACFQE1_00440 [Halobium palmae]|uniref:Restriction endonuclease n=1 Tax=Halobium palmae TaxID=1776492 RepID=A0ABD5RTY8_9EURY